MRALATAVLVALAGCPDPLGQPCEQDEQCGPGFDCFQNVCVRVCTKDDECGADETCYRYHCVSPGQEPGRPRAGKTVAPPSARPVPPAPDVTGAELRAIRRELELLRREQARLANAIEQMQGAKKPTDAHRTPSAKKPADAGRTPGMRSAPIKRRRE